ncbi:hypothetical protein CRUP_035371 [Coryphaenoides rupestris]|nr:hypothetical protein CRUP_035371 [Coryphaenoides rupestris]
MVLCVLKGGYKFCCDLVEHIKAIGRSANNVVLFWVKVSGCFRSAVVVEPSGQGGAAGRSEETRGAIVDTGKTIKAVLKHVETFQPKMVKVAALLVKRVPNIAENLPDYVGFEIPDRFVVGYALDYNEYFRDLNHICVISEVGKLKYKI